MCSCKGRTVTMNKSKWRHVPNILTILRLIAVPVMALLMISGKLTEGLIVFAAAELTDILDGYIARKYNFITNFGKLADPFADKAIQLTALLLLARGGRLPYYFFFIWSLRKPRWLSVLCFSSQRDCGFVRLGWEGCCRCPFCGNRTCFSKHSCRGLHYVGWYRDFNRCVFRVP